MNKWTTTIGATLASIILTACVYGWAAAPSTQPSHEGSKSESKSGKWGFSPYNKLSSVTDEQKMKINDIHRKFVAERKALEDKQESDVMSVLTDEQKMELEKMKAEEKAKNAAKRKSGKDKDEDDKDK